MEWSKIKNVIILILLILNLFLLGLVISRESKSARYQDEARSGMVAVLEKNGIEFRPERVPDNLELVPMAVTRSRDSERHMAEKILGNAKEKDTGSGVRIVYTGKGGTASFSSDGRFAFQLNDQAQIAAGQSPEQVGEECLRLLDLDGTLIETREEKGAVVLDYHQNWHGVPLFSCRIEVTVYNGKPVSIEGEQLAGTSAAEEAATLDTLTILMRFLSGISESGYVCSRINSMTAGYLSGVSVAQPTISLMPVWCIDTDTGQYYVDAVTGELTLAE